MSGLIQMFGSDRKCPRCGGDDITAHGLISIACDDCGACSLDYGGSMFNPDSDEYKYVASLEGNVDG